MTHWTRFSIVIGAGLLVSGCDRGPSGPSKSVAGNWAATGCCMGSQRYELSLTQQGDLIEGVACSTISGIVGAKTVAVSGRYPNVRFDLTGPVVIGGEPRSSSIEGENSAAVGDASIAHVEERPPGFEHTVFVRLHELFEFGRLGELLELLQTPRTEDLHGLRRQTNQDTNGFIAADEEMNLLRVL